MESAFCRRHARAHGPRLKPPCFDTDLQWQRWLEAAAWAKTPVSQHTHCQDCMPAHKARMEQAGRCSNPEYKFDQETT